MFHKKMEKTCSSICIVGIFFLAVFAILSINSTASGQTSINPEDNSSQTPTSFPNLSLNNNDVYISIKLINIFNYQYTTGDCIMDMYINFFWNNPSITTIDWHLANGFPITPTSITLLSSNTTGEIRYQIYRATVHLNSQPDASNFPFDNINLTVSTYLLPHGDNTNLNWLTNQTGIDSEFLNPGWKTIDLNLYTPQHTHPLEGEVPTAKMVITQQRELPAQSITPFVPPAIFSLVCACSFVFSLKDKGSVGLRLGLVNSMLVATILFSFTISGAIPPASSVILYSVFLLSVLIFMVITLIVTIAGLGVWLKNQNEKQVVRVNQLGFLLAIIVPVLIFVLLFFFLGS
jgi:hypothetical protein